MIVSFVSHASRFMAAYFQSPAEIDKRLYYQLLGIARDPTLLPQPKRLLFARIERVLWDESDD